MDRIVIIGNSGSGKTHLAKRLSEHFGLWLIHLDALFWEPGGFNVKRPWAAAYWLRDDLRSQRGHQLIFERFTGDKVRLTSRAAVDDFVADVTDS